MKPALCTKFFFACFALGFTTLSHGATTTNAPTPAPVPAAATKPVPTAPPPTPAGAAAAPAPAAIDFGDGSSSTLTTKAWKCLEAKDYAGVKAYTQKCIDSFKTQAIAMQATLKAPAPNDSANQYWALNDVGSCFFIQGKAADDQGDKKSAIASYKFLVDNLSFAQCWDPKGWFWPPAQAARKRLAELQFDAAQ